MKNLFNFLASGILLVLFSGRAQATPLTGALTIDGGVGAITPSVLNTSTSSLRPGGVIIALGGSGALASVPILESVVFVSSFTFAVGGPSLLGEQLLSFVENGVTETFDVTKVSIASNGSLTLFGVLSDGNVADNAIATYVLTPNVSGDGSFSSTLNIPHAPEPDSFYLMGTGLAMIAGLVTLKRGNSVQA